MCDRDIAIACPSVPIRRHYVVYHKIYKFHRIPHLVMCNCRVLCRRSHEDQRVVSCSVIDFVGDTDVSVWIEFHRKVQLFSFDGNLDIDYDQDNSHNVKGQESVVSLIRLPLSGSFCTCRVRRDCESPKQVRKRYPLRRQRRVEEPNLGHFPSNELKIEEEDGWDGECDRKVPEEIYWCGIDRERKCLIEGSDVPQARSDSIHPRVSGRQGIGGSYSGSYVTAHLSVANEVGSGDGANCISTSDMVRSPWQRYSSMEESVLEQWLSEDVNGMVNASRVAGDEESTGQRFSDGVWAGNSMVIDSRVLAWIVSYVRDAVFVALTRSPMLNHGYHFTFLYHICVECETHWPITFEPNRVRFLAHSTQQTLAQIPFPRLLLEVTIPLQFTGQHYTASGIQCRKLNTLLSAICPPRGMRTSTWIAMRKVWRHTLRTPCARPVPEFLVSLTLALTHRYKCKGQIK